MRQLKLGSITILSGLLMLASVTANASIFSLIGGTGGLLPDDWNPSPNTTGLAIDDDITIFDSADEGIWLDGDADLVYTYIGKEAGSTNASSTSTSDRFFITGSTAPNTIFETTGSSGYLDFSFEGLGTCCVDPGTFTNGLGNSGANGGLSLAVVMLNPTSLYLMFGDGFGDADYDDMVLKVEISAVPLPAAVWLFGTALIGLVGFSKRRKSA